LLEEEPQPVDSVRKAIEESKTALQNWSFMIACLGKKIGADRGDPNLHAQPRLPGSVVGEASMRQVAGSIKITEVIVLW